MICMQRAGTFIWNEMSFAAFGMMGSTVDDRSVDRVCLFDTAVARARRQSKAVDAFESLFPRSAIVNAWMGSLSRLACSIIQVDISDL
jgi:hypothetical protein